jgi:HEAT repeat protein
MKQRLLAGVAFVLVLFAYGCARREPVREPVYEGKPVSSWIADLKDRDREVRDRAVAALEHLAKDSPDAIPALVDSLSTKEYRCKQGCFSPESTVRALSRIGRPAQPALTEALRHPNQTLRAGAAEALLRMGDDGKAALIRALGHERAGRALADYEGEDGVHPGDVR